MKLNLAPLRRWLALMVFVVSLLASTNLIDIVPGTDISYSEIFRIQFIPAFMAGSILILAIIIVGTLVFGRIYCSLVCPLGILQDVLDKTMRTKIFLKRPYKFKVKKANRGYKSASNKVRYSILLLTVLLFVSGSSLFILLLDPYSNFGRLSTTFVNPVITTINNLLASIFNTFEIYYFVNSEFHVSSFTSILFSTLVLGVLVYLVKKFGRSWCNSVCPVGTLLGLISRWSLIKIRINNSDCISCNLCVKECKSLCINSKTNRIDYSRCVTCFNCIDNCSTEAISYSVSKPKKKDG